MQRETEAAISGPIAASALVVDGPGERSETIVQAAPSAEESGPATPPIMVPPVDLAELGVADRLGLDKGDDEEVGPVS